MKTGKPTIHSAVISGGFTFVGILLAMRLSHYDYSYLGWLLGGALMGVGVMLGFVAPAKRSAWKWLYSLTAPGVLGGIVYNLF
jgi:hypothetical protein